MGALNAEPFKTHVTRVPVLSRTPEPANSHTPSPHVSLKAVAALHREYKCDWETLPSIGYLKKLLSVEAWEAGSAACGSPEKGCREPEGWGDGRGGLWEAPDGRTSPRLSLTCRWHHLRRDEGHTHSALRVWRTEEMGQQRDLTSAMQQGAWLGTQSPPLGVIQPMGALALPGQPGRRRPPADWPNGSTGVSDKSQKSCRLQAQVDICISDTYTQGLS